MGFYSKVTVVKRIDFGADHNNYGNLTIYY